MKTFFQFAEQAKKHRREKMLQEADAQPVAGQAPAVDYKTFGANWTKFSQDPANAGAIQALSKTIPQLAQMGQLITKMATPAPAPTTTPAATTTPATGTAPAPAAAPAKV